MKQFFVFVSIIPTYVDVSIVAANVEVQKFLDGKFVYEMIIYFLGGYAS